nr:MAG TPA: hypothetical protein [Caudoviricetes sp.]DAN29047.1 MAG TPA: hypothetical protein [Caudoviricetes sp.]DAS43293.1 MAG TPA: hypothetical protein [Caudoviricetes sp.]DAS98658.1 MAG TPA: hypothetical protein [Caudoviricetes sp.]DAT20243.1 MAG TPA: hypothetical protein [Caudoviricetes sp.]
MLYSALFVRALFLLLKQAPPYQALEFGVGLISSGKSSPGIFAPLRLLHIL